MVGGVGGAKVNKVVLIKTYSLDGMVTWSEMRCAGPGGFRRSWVPQLGSTIYQRGPGVRQLVPYVEFLVVTTLRFFGRTSRIVKNRVITDHGQRRHGSMI